jgi:lon-related putative ATP-dependent protease
MTDNTPLEPTALRRRCDPASLPFETTVSLEPLPELPGQGRALEALRFGVGLRAHDYNIFAVGPTGLGKHAVVRAMLEERAAAEPVPDDWCFVYNFTDRHVPRALALPAGRAVGFRGAMDGLVSELRAAVRSALEGDAFAARKKALVDEIAQHHEQAVEAVQQEAADRGFAFDETPEGFALTPLKDGKPLEVEELERLPAAEREKIHRDMHAIHEQLAGLLAEASEWSRAARTRLAHLIAELALEVVREVMARLRGRFADLPAVSGYLAEVERDLVGRSEDLLGDEADEEKADAREPSSGILPELPVARRYRVNVLTDHTDATCAPVVYEDNPTYANLFGRVEHVQVMGALLTDYNLIKAGALHRANGGYLILDALKVLQQPFVWEGLKRALKSKQLRTESPVEALGLASTVALEPAPIPLDVKVVLVGDRWVHQLLVAYDPEVRELFKVQADFAEELPWDDEAPTTYGRLLAAIARREKTRPIDATAVARLVEEGARRAGDRQRLSIDLQALSDLVREAERFAMAAGDARIRAAHVERALEQRVRRVDRVREEMIDRIARGIVLISTSGRAVGQVNGLSVMQVADFMFGGPTRITARARLGKGHVLDIEREVELGGPIHSKGVLILEGFLGARYAPDLPLSLSASLVFEQSYSGIEGDSASVAELCCLLSAIAEVPLRQDVAVTGSVNQHGQVQPVGGLDEKVEGFFDVCRKVGLTGTQGVVVPRANLDHLMLRQDVVDAVAGGRFHVWAVTTVDEALEVLGGLPAGARDDEGRWPDGSFNERVQARLASFAEAARAFAAGADAAITPR